MNPRKLRTRRAVVGASLTLVLTLAAHETGTSHGHAVPPAVKPLPFAIEGRGPVKPPKAAPQARTSGQGFWRFVAVTNGLLPVPPEAIPFLKGAHGTLVVDPDADVVYWGLERVGWIAFRERLTKSEVVRGDPAFASGNLHGADLWRRRGQPPLVAVADNVEGEVYVSDTAFQIADKLRLPPGGPYADQKGFAPTDVAFTSAGEIYVTDGYGKAYFMPARTEPLDYRGVFLGGKEVSQTPHGITFSPATKSLIVSARPEARLLHWSPRSAGWVEVQGLPPGSTVCDVDLWGDYALAPCLDGPNNAPGPIYILNLKARTIVSTLRPKEDLGFADAQHIHDACWYFAGKGRRREVYVLFTNWNPGGIGALKLVSVER